MKKIVFLLLVFSTSFGYSQMTVNDVDSPKVIGEYKLLGTLYAELAKKDDIIIFTYRDEKFQTIDNYKSFSFLSNDIDTLYNLLTDFSNVEKGDEKEVTVEDGGVLRLEYKKSFGRFYVDIYHIDKTGTIGKIRYLTPKQMKKLFNK